MKILHLSDTHLYGDATLHYGQVDTSAALAGLLSHLSTVESLDLLVCSGDCTDDGTEAAYRKLRDLLEPFAAERGAQVVYAMGNHDDRASFQTVLGAVDRVHQVGATRVITLDSSVPGKAYGHLEPPQLDWLRDQLAEPADGGTVLVLHHPPVPAVTEMLRRMQLTNPDELAAVVHGSDVRLILCGHYHHPLTDTFAGVPVVVGAAVANLHDASAPDGTERAYTGSSATFIELTEAGPRVLGLSAPGDQREIFHLTEAEVQAVVTAAGTQS